MARALELLNRAFLSVLHNADHGKLVIGVFEGFYEKLFDDKHCKYNNDLFVDEIVSVLYDEIRRCNLGNYGMKKTVRLCFFCKEITVHL